MDKKWVKVFIELAGIIEPRSWLLNSEQFARAGYCISEITTRARLLKPVKYLAADEKRLERSEETDLLWTVARIGAQRVVERSERGQAVKYACTAAAAPTRDVFTQFTRGRVKWSGSRTRRGAVQALVVEFKIN